MVGRAAVLGLLVVGAACAAEPPGAFPGEERRIADELRSAAKLDDAPAVKRYQEILAESGDRLVPADEAGTRLVPARWLAHAALAKRSPQARKLYRESADGPARKLLEQGAAARDARVLERVVAEAFCSRPAEAALHLLGDLAFERGEFETAERFWRTLAPPASKPNPDGLTYPDPQDPALARAKQILAALFAGDVPRAKRELDTFRKFHADAEGALAGRKGKYAETLANLLATERPAPSSAPADSDPAAWGTFAGESSRNRIIPDRVTPYWPVLPQWTAPLPSDPGDPKRQPADVPPGSFAAARGLAAFPVVAAGCALVADPVRVAAYDLLTGQRVALYDHRAKNPMPPSLAAAPPYPGVRCPLTVTDDRVYARFGATTRQPQAEKPAEEEENAIACLALARGPTGAVTLAPRWQMRARAADSTEPAFFEAAPLVRAGRMWLARTRYEGGHAVTWVECYDADTPGNRGEPPALRWKQAVWSINVAALDPARPHQEPLTLAGSNVAFCTHSGAVVALDAATGRFAWAVRYPRVPPAPPDGAPPRDLAPPAYAAGRLFVAPADSDRVFAYDARTGERLWQSEPLRTVHLLGASRGKVFVTLGGMPHGLRALDAATGEAKWTRPDDGDRATFGRGFLTERWVFWPTRQGLVVLNQDDGEAVDAGLPGGPLGNLAFADGFLLVATPDELWGYVPERAKLGQRRRDFERSGDPAALYRLALAEADAGQVEQAAADFAKVDTDAARHRRFEVLLGRSDAAAGPAFAPADRLRALARQAKPDWSPVLNDEAFRDVWVTDGAGFPQRAVDLALTRMAPEDRAKTKVFAVAADVRTDWRDRAVQAEVEGRSADAAEAWRELQRGSRHVPEDAAARAPWWQGMARAYEKLGHLAEARALRRRVEQDAEKPLSPDPRPKETLFAPDLPLPLARAWEVPLAPLRESVLVPTGPDDRFYVSDGRRIACRSAETGQPLWDKEVGHGGAWCARYADSVIAAGPDGVSRLRRDDGRVVWTFRVPDPYPVTAPLLRTLAEPSSPPPLTGFRLAGMRVLVQWGGRALLALDAETGRVLWRLNAPGAPVRTPEAGGAFDPMFLGTLDYVLLRTTGGQFLIVDATSGRVRRSGTAAVAWAADPAESEPGRAAIATAANRVVGLELRTGDPAWPWEVELESTLSGEPPQIRVVGDEILIVVARNHGYELERFRCGGERISETPVPLGMDRPDLAAADFDAGLVYLPCGSVLLAVARADGHVAWAASLPVRAAWKVTASRTAVVAYAAQPVPAAGRFPSGIAAVYDGWVRRRLPVLVLDPTDGRPLEAMTFAASGPRGAVLVGPKSLTVWAEGRVWGVRGEK